MELAYINENTEESDAMFSCSDNRGHLYEDMDYIPVSALSAVIWEDEDSYSEAVFDITNSGDLSVTKPIADVFMSFDPYGVAFLPNKLQCMDGLSTQQRYIIAINNELDVLDEEKSSIESFVEHYDPKEHGYDVPLEERESFHSVLVQKLYLDREKLETYPMNRRHIFRVKGTNSFFFSSEIYDELYIIARQGLACGLTAFKFDVDDEAPRR
ncbi:MULTISPECIES: imm11 family protein [unclassified Shewanella]|uniref:imm11 family protein n=1 Tax=unclassified Shewanella TaxID=196818 RepID=UPI0039B4B0DE